VQPLFGGTRKQRVGRISIRSGEAARLRTVFWLLEGLAALVSAGTAKTRKLSRRQTPADQGLKGFQRPLLLWKSNRLVDQEQPLSMIP